MLVFWLMWWEEELTGSWEELVWRLDQSAPWTTSTQDSHSIKQMHLQPTTGIHTTKRD